MSLFEIVMEYVFHCGYIIHIIYLAITFQNNEHNYLQFWLINFIMNTIVTTQNINFFDMAHQSAWNRYLKNAVSFYIIRLYPKQIYLTLYNGTACWKHALCVCVCVWGCRVGLVHFWYIFDISLMQNYLRLVYLNNNLRLVLTTVYGSY